MKVSGRRKREGIERGKIRKVTWLLERRHMKNLGEGFLVIVNDILAPMISLQKQLS